MRPDAMKQSVAFLRRLLCPLVLSFSLVDFFLRNADYFFDELLKAVKVGLARPILKCFLRSRHSSAFPFYCRLRLSTFSMKPYMSPSRPRGVCSTSSSAPSLLVQNPDDNCLATCCGSLSLT